MSREGGIRIREARRADFAGLCALWSTIDDYHARLRPDFFQAPRAGAAGQGSCRTRQGFEQLLRRTDVALFVAEAQALLGLVSVQLYETPEEARMVRCWRAHVDELVVARGHRRRGIGRRLMEVAADWARRRGAAQVVLTVWAGNRGASRFYRQLGYAPICQVLGLPLGRADAGRPGMADGERRR